MKVYLVESFIGIFVLDERGKIVSDKLFEKNPVEAVQKLRDLKEGKTSQELSTVLRGLKKKYNSITVDQEYLKTPVLAVWRGECLVEPSSEVIQEFRKTLPAVAVKLKVMNTEREYEDFVRKVTIEMARTAVGIAATKRDMHAIQAVRAIDDLDKMQNLFATRIREWYGLHYPELDRLVDKHETYVRIVARLGSRANLTEQNMLGMGVSEGQARSVSSAARSSMGGEISEDDLRWLREFCQYWLECSALREKAEHYLEELMVKVAPNVNSLAGPLLGARLLSIAGSLETLAKMPASTIQVLGAEKALFRSMRSGARPPKHGIIFQHLSIHQAPRSQRGKIARALSGKLAIAARLDQYGGEFMGDDLRSAFEERVRAISKK